MEELKGCPFCGGDDIYYTARGTKFGAICFIECHTCGAMTRAYGYQGEIEEIDCDDVGMKKAIEAWNRREQS